MQSINFQPLYLSLQLALISTILLILIGIPISWWLSQTKQNKTKIIIETIIALPLVIPPTILGFYLLLLFNQHNILGKIWFIIIGTKLAFSFPGLVIASCIYSLPFIIQPIQLAFEKLGKRPIEQALILQQSKIKIFFKIIIPLSKTGIITGAILTFAHTLGEFGVVLMVGGNIPGKTQVISIAIYELVEELNYNSTHILSIITIAISSLILIALFSLNNKKTK